MFSSLSKKTLLRAALLHDAPVYVQFYLTARCNLTCKQCNIIYANSDVRECTLEEIKRIADNFAAMGVAMVLLTGGEPFIRQDLPEIIREFESRGVHVRMQSNGLATEERIQKVIAYGGRDISISIDSLWPSSQDEINGGFAKSWQAALRSIAAFTQHLPKQNSFASLGCVLQRDNLGDIEDVIRFGTEISWLTSLVPIHITTFDKPMSFRTYDQAQQWKPEEIPYVHAVVERVRAMRNEGYLLYDSDPYLDDIKRFVAQQPIAWRQRNANVCDTPNLYFAVLPNGEFAPCCDHRIGSHVRVYDRHFPSLYRSRPFREEVLRITSACSGCMYGSYPEMTISMRHLRAKWERVKLFLASPPTKNWPVSYERLLSIAERIRNEPRERVSLSGRSTLGPDRRENAAPV